ncbi:MAG: hypothetical protein OHK0038_16200 [Flammeovirgaceae bacterium]
MAKKIKLILAAIFGFILLIFVLVILFYQYASYSDGYRAGVVIKLSRRGYIFKTYEGELNVEGINTNKIGSLTSVWEFSVDSDNELLIKQLDEVALTKERVKLYYEEKYAKLFWRGETKYIVTKLERISQHPEYQNSVTSPTHSTSGK